MKRLSNNLSAASAVVIAASLLVSDAPAWAQHQLGDGRGLDNNMQSGSGGYNAPRQQNPYGRYSDAIITGNVGGLGAFRDPVGYRASGEFTDVTATNDTFDFRRRALPQSVRPTEDMRFRPSTQNPQAGPRFAEGTVIQRGGTGARSGDVSRQVQQYPGNFFIDDPRDASGRGLLPDRPMDELLRDRFTGGPRDAGWRADESGQLLRITTSPLTGMREQIIGQWRLPELADDEEAARQREQEDADEERRPDEDEQAEARRELQRRQVGRIDALAGGERVDRRLGGVDARVDRRASTGRIDPLQDAVATLEERGRFQPGEDAYVDLLREIEQQLPEDMELGSVSRPIGGEDGEPSRLDELFAEFERIQRGEAADADADREEDVLDRLSRGLSYDLPRIETFAGRGDSEINRLLARAEQMMQRGQYFQAEGLYDQVLLRRPDYAIAEMGRVHAQLGAGLYQSAASSLRFALATNPQLISAQYGEGLLPDAPRLQQIERDLAELATSDVEAAALLSSYLAYQQGRPDDVADSLRRLEEGAGEGAAMPRLLERIWLEEQEGEAEGDAPDLE